MRSTSSPLKLGLALLAAALILPAFASAQTSRRFHSNCSRCGQAVYQYRIVAGYDRHRHPIYHWAARPHTNCASSRHHHSRVPSYSHSRSPVYRSRSSYPSHYYNRSYGQRYYGSSSCPSSRGGASFHFSIRR